MQNNDVPGIGGESFEVTLNSKDFPTSKYFTPDIEDLRIGYECEICINYGYESFNKGEEIWKPKVINLKDSEGAYLGELGDILAGIDDGYQPVRVPYLTEEQIVAEGWTEYIRLENMNYLFCKKESNYMIAWFFNENRISILVKDPSKVIDLKGNIVDYNDTPRYTGECKDINEFRYICKLLKI